MSGLLARGDVLSFVMADGHELKLPKNFFLLHDPDGKLIDRCALVCCRCHFDTHEVRAIPQRLRQHAADYFGDGWPLRTGVIDPPKGAWHSVGVVNEIRYYREGEYKDHAGAGYYHPYHPYPDSVELFRMQRGSAYLLVLPAGCIVDSRGFVEP